MDGRSSRRDKHLLKTHHALPLLSRLVENLKRNGFCSIKMNPDTRNPVLMASVETNAVPKCVDFLRE